MRYAKPEDVFAALKIDATSMDADIVALRERVIRVENGLADNFDQEINTSFGVAATAETRTVWSNGSYVEDVFGSWYPEYDEWGYHLHRKPTQMILSTRIRSVSAIRTGGDWDGATWVDDELVPVANYVLNYQDGDGYWGIQALTGHWNGVYRITGIWSDQRQGGDIPDDVREALTFLTIDQYRMLTGTPNTQLGPDGLSVQVRNPWRWPSIQATVQRHRVIELVV